MKRFFDRMSLTLIAVLAFLWSIPVGLILFTFWFDARETERVLGPRRNQIQTLKSCEDGSPIQPCLAALSEIYAIELKDIETKDKNTGEQRELLFDDKMSLPFYTDFGRIFIRIRISNGKIEEFKSEVSPGMKY